jgi:hypothetical protein
MYMAQDVKKVTLVALSEQWCYAFIPAKAITPVSLAIIRPA